MRAVLAQLLQLGSTLAELGEPWPPMTPHLPPSTAPVSFLMPWQVCGVQGSLWTPLGGEEGARGVMVAVALGREAAVCCWPCRGSGDVFLLPYERSHSCCSSRLRFSSGLSLSLSMY